MAVLLQPPAPASDADAASPAAFWPAYRAWRLAQLAQPFGAADQALAATVAAALRRCLGLDSDDANRQGRRYVFQRRERCFHEALALDLPADRLRALLDAAPVRGAEHLQAAPRDAGLLLLSLHYGAYSSLLCLSLARAAGRRVLPPLTIVLNSGAAGALGFPERRASELEAAGLGSRATTTFLDMRSEGAARRLVRALRGGETVLLLPDAALTAAPGASDAALSLGRLRLALPRGIESLAPRTGARVLPVYSHAAGDAYGLCFGPITSPAAPAPVRSAVQWLLDGPVAAAPGAWEGWAWAVGAPCQR
jgi:lauroyl/myristoyl acyltransferase